MVEARGEEGLFYPKNAETQLRNPNLLVEVCDEVPVPDADDDWDRDCDIDAVDDGDSDAVTVSDGVCEGVPEGFCVIVPEGVDGWLRELERVLVPDGLSVPDFVNDGVRDCVCVEDWEGVGLTVPEADDDGVAEILLV